MSFEHFKDQEQNLFGKKGAIGRLRISDINLTRRATGDTLRLFIRARIQHIPEEKQKTSISFEMGRATFHYKNIRIYGEYFNPEGIEYRSMIITSRSFQSVPRPRFFSVQPDQINTYTLTIPIEIIHLILYDLDFAPHEKDLELTEEPSIDFEGYYVEVENGLFRKDHIKDSDTFNIPVITEIPFAEWKRVFFDKLSYDDPWIFRIDPQQISNLFSEMRLHLSECLHHIRDNKPIDALVRLRQAIDSFQSHDPTVQFYSNLVLKPRPTGNFPSKAERLSMIGSAIKLYCDMGAHPQGLNLSVEDAKFMYRLVLSLLAFS